MQGAEIKRAVIEEISNLPFHKVSSNGIQYTVRCPYCGDSNKANHGHFSIKIDENDEYSPMIFRCFKCDTSGLLTKDVINDLGLNISNQLTDELGRFNQKSAKYNKFTDTRVESFVVPESNSIYADYKLDYINNRLGTSFNYEDAKDLKIILGLEDFIVMNQINTIVGITPKQVKFYDKHYVGFLSSNRNCITMRAIDDYASMRYVKIVLNPRNLDPNTFYAIPNTIDLLYHHDINIHITEGTFDALGVYTLNNFDKENNFYYAVCGYGYNTILRGLIRMGFTTGLNIHIYADNDKRDSEIIWRLQNEPRVYPWLDKIYVHRNGYKGQKDYGVNKSLILDRYTQIK